MDSRGRPRVTLKVMFFALLDGAGIIVLSSGAMWLFRGQTLFIPNFPTSAPTAVITIVAGISLMLWATAQVLRELIKSSGDGAADGS